MCFLIYRAFPRAVVVFLDVLLKFLSVVSCTERGKTSFEWLVVYLYPYSL